MLLLGVIATHLQKIIFQNSITLNNLFLFLNKKSSAPSQPPTFQTPSQPRHLYYCNIFMQGQHKTSTKSYTKRNPLQILSQPQIYWKLMYLVIWYLLIIKVGGSITKSDPHSPKSIIHFIHIVCKPKPLDIINVLTMWLWQIIRVKLIS
jgi:hypothetical protein